MSTLDIELTADIKRLLRLPPYEDFIVSAFFEEYLHDKYGEQVVEDACAQLTKKYGGMLAERVVLEQSPGEAERQVVESMIIAWREKREHRLAEEKKVEELKRQEQSFKNWLIEVFREQRFEGMVIGGRVTGLSVKEVPVVEDREAFSNYIIETGQLDLLQFRLSTAAIKEREDAGVEIPGLGHTDTYDLFNRKA